MARGNEHFISALLVEEYTPLVSPKAAERNYKNAFFLTQLGKTA
jgi:hypothetical protein